MLILQNFVFCAMAGFQLGSQGSAEGHTGCIQEKPIAQTKESTNTTHTLTTQELDSAEETLQLSLEWNTSLNTDQQLWQRVYPQYDLSDSKWHRVFCRSLTNSRLHLYLLFFKKCFMGGGVGWRALLTILKSCLSSKFHSSTSAWCTPTSWQYIWVTSKQKWLSALSSQLLRCRFGTR